MFTHAIIRLPGENFSDGLTSGMFGKPDYARTLLQHYAYCQALNVCGLDVTTLEPDQEFPDSTFVEDTAVLVPGCAIITRPGAASRTGETATIQEALRSFYDHFEYITDPGTVDGGDICEAGNHFFIGVSDRTNIEGASQLSDILRNLGYTSSQIDIRGCRNLLHLKSGLAYLGDGNLVLVEDLHSHPALKDFYSIVVDVTENYAANCVRINKNVLIPDGNPILQNKLENLGYALISLNMTEFQKMDGGLSCLSLRF
jgi:dimethylargininase